VVACIFKGKRCERCWPGLADAHSCLAQWTKTISCPVGGVYRDEREHAGGEEFCEHFFPGSLKVKDGPSQSWISEGHPGEEGNYSEGRKVGSWTECDRWLILCERYVNRFAGDSKVVG